MNEDLLIWRVALKFKLYTDVHEFYNDTYDVLMCHKTHNMLPLGISLLDTRGKINRLENGGASGQLDPKRGATSEHFVLKCGHTSAFGGR